MFLELCLLYLDEYMFDEPGAGKEDKGDIIAGIRADKLDRMPAATSYIELMPATMGRTDETERCFQASPTFDRLHTAAKPGERALRRRALTCLPLRPTPHPPPPKLAVRLEYFTRHSSKTKAFQ